MILAWTGHRPERLGGYNPNPLQDRVRGAIHGVIMAIRADLVITGMALGVDTWVAEACIRIGIPFVAAVPFPEQDSKWSAPQREHYRKLLQLAAGMHVVCPIYQPDAYQLRNEWMIDKCDMLAAVWNTAPNGGTANAVHYSQKIERPMIHIDPRKL